MNGIIETGDGRKYTLPRFSSFEIRNTDGSSADSFRVTFPYASDAGIFENAAYFTAEYENTPRFHGIVDEITVTTRSGRAVTLEGRGMAGRLMDNEAEAADFRSCGLSDILSRIVRPCGITDIMTDGTFPSVSGFSIRSGETCWSVLSSYTDKARAILPRFDGAGRLILSDKKGKRILLNDNTAVFDVSYRRKRYGVVSEVLVKTVHGTRVTVKNEDAVSHGIMAKRVLMAEKNTPQADMRYMGEKLIRRSVQDGKKLTLSVPSLFAAFPADTVDVSLMKIGITGEFTVTETVTWADAKSFGTEITMRENV